MNVTFREHRYNGYIITFSLNVRIFRLSLTVLEGCVSDMGPRKVQWDRQSAHPFFHGLATGHSSLQQVKITQIIAYCIHFTFGKQRLVTQKRQVNDRYVIFVIKYDKKDLCIFSGKLQWPLSDTRVAYFQFIRLRICKSKTEGIQFPS